VLTPPVRAGLVYPAEVGGMQRCVSETDEVRYLGILLVGRILLGSG